MVTHYSTIDPNYIISSILPAEQNAFVNYMQSEYEAGRYPQWNYMGFSINPELEPGKLAFSAYDAEFYDPTSPNLQGFGITTGKADFLRDFIAIETQYNASKK